MVSMTDGNTGEVREMADGDERTDNRIDNSIDNRATDDDTETYVMDGTRSLGGVLREYGINLSDFLERNDLDKVIIAADVVLYLPKKV